MSVLTVSHSPTAATRRDSRDAVVIPFPTRHPVRPARSPQPVLRLTRRGRLVVTLLVTAVLTLVGIVAATGAPPVPEPSRARVERVVVLPGDTLWGIAATRAAPGDDVRDLVADIVEINALPGSGVAVGQELSVPAPLAD